MIRATVRSLLAIAAIPLSLNVAQAESSRERTARKSRATTSRLATED